MKKTRRGFPARKSGYPTCIRMKKPISGKPEIGAPRVSWMSMPWGEVEYVPLGYC
jgi:hypothetical protein